MLDKTPNRKDMKNPLEAAVTEYRRMSEADRVEMLNWIWYILLNNFKDEDAKKEIMENFKQGEAEKMVYGIDRLVEQERLRGEKRGEKIGEKKAEKKAEKEKRERNKQLIEKMLRRGDTTNEISDLLEVTIEEVENVKIKLK